MNITLLGTFNLSDNQHARLSALGTVNQPVEPTSADDWLEKAQGANVICSDGSFLLENLKKLSNVLITYPYIELGSFDSEALRAKGVLVANTRGSNRDSIVEWTMYMILASLRKFPTFVRVTESPAFERTKSLSGKKVLVIGKGNIGTQIGAVCEAFGMQVDYFVRADDLHAKAAQADVIVNALSVNSTSQKLLDEAFFAAMKSDSYFVSFVRHYTYDIAGLIKALDSGILAGAAIDCDPEPLFDATNEFYQTCLAHDKILVTPHVAAITDQSGLNAMETLVQNVEAFAKGAPQNIVVKQ